MKNIQKITATQARNNFFTLIDRSYKENISYIIEKAHIPVVYIIPATSSIVINKEEEDRKKNLKILKRLDKFRKLMPLSSDSVKLLREIRLYGK